MRRLVLIAFVLSLAVAGCAVDQVHKDQDKLRCALLELYTDQIADNLIRASNGMPIIQLDYTNAAATITVQDTASMSDSVASTYSSVATQALAITRTTLNTLTCGLTSQHTNQVAVTATPVITSNSVYDAYLQFLAIPGSLRVSTERPPDCAVHVCKKVGDKYYFVPIEFKYLYLRLALITTAQRGQLLVPPDEFFTVTLQQILGVRPGQFNNVFLVAIKLDKKVPNDQGVIKFTLDKQDLEYTTKVFVTETGMIPSETDTIVVVLNLNPTINSVDAIKAKFPLAVKLSLEHVQPKPPGTDELLRQMTFQLDQIRMNQLRTNQ